MPNGIEWAVDRAPRSCASAAVLVPLSTLLRPPELDAQLQRRRRSPTSCVVRAFRGRAYLDDLEAVAPGHRGGDRGAAPPPRAAVAPRTCGSPTSSPRRRGRRRARRRARKPRCGRPTTSSCCSRRAAGARPKGDDPHARQRAARRRAGPRRPPRRRRRPPLHPDAVLLDGRVRRRAAHRARRRRDAAHRSRRPSPTRTLALLERERVDAVPRLARPGRAPRGRTPRSRPPTCRAAARAAWPRCCRPSCSAAPGARAEPLRHDRDVRPVLRRPARPRPAPKPSTAAAGSPFDGVEVRIVDPDTGDAVARRRAAARSELRGSQPDARHLRPRTQRRRSTPTASTRPATSARSTPTATSGTTAASTTCSRSRARPCTRPRSKPRCAPSTACGRRTSPTCPTPTARTHVGALVVVGRLPLDELVAGGTRAAERVQGADRAGSSTDSADDVPMTADRARSTRPRSRTCCSDARTTDTTRGPPR